MALSMRPPGSKWSPSVKAPANYCCPFCSLSDPDVNRRPQRPARRVMKPILESLKVAHDKWDQYKKTGRVEPKESLFPDCEQCVYFRYDGQSYFGYLMPNGQVLLTYTEGTRVKNKPAAKQVRFLMTMVNVKAVDDL